MSENGTGFASLLKQDAQLGFCFQTRMFQAPNTSQDTIKIFLLVFLVVNVLIFIFIFYFVHSFVPGTTTMLLLLFFILAMARPMCILRPHFACRAKCIPGWPFCIPAAGRMHSSLAQGPGAAYYTYVVPKGSNMEDL